tara:strand:+ start:5516 stop:6463 length:948 start_codon:yes stop_codon:yes gene_type:complete
MKTVGCIIPCFKGNNKTITVIKDALKFVDYVVLIDDLCPNKIGEIASKQIKSNNLIIIKNIKNLGVGGSVKRGIEYLLSNNCDIILKIDADGQINPKLIPKIIEPIVNGTSEAVKGNRFTSLEDVLSMPKIRIIGNLGLSFLNKISTGYWELFDPTNGFIAFSSKTLKKIRLNKVDNRYFFESDLLFQCSLANVYFKQLPMESIYGDEISSLKPLKEISKFAWKHFLNTFKRIIYQYFILDFNAGSLDLLGCLSTGTITSIYYLYIKYIGLEKGFNATPAQANILAILIILTFQLILAFIYYDSTQKPLLRRIKE